MGDSALINEKICNLANNKCVPCAGGIPTLSHDKVVDMFKELDSGWMINKLGHLYKVFNFPDFISSMEFANKIAEIAEEEGHHPDLHISWGLCSCEIWTHKVNGLTESDFFLAAKIELIIS